MATQPTSCDIEFLRSGLIRGEADAYRLLVRGLTEPLYRYAAGALGDPDAARDVAQQTFVRLYRARKRLDAGGNLRTLCFTIAANLARNALRDRALREQREREAAMQRSETKGAHIPELADAAWSMLPSLEPEVREVLLLHFAHGFSLSETAEVLAIPAGTAKTRCRRGLEELREKLAGHKALTVGIGADALGSSLFSSPVRVPSNLVNVVEAGVMASIGTKSVGLIAACVLLLLALGGGAAFVILGDDLSDAGGKNDTFANAFESDERNGRSGELGSGTSVPPANGKRDNVGPESDTQPPAGESLGTGSNTTGDDARSSGSSGTPSGSGANNDTPKEEKEELPTNSNDLGNGILARFGSKLPFDAGSTLWGIALSPGDAHKIAVCGEDYFVGIWDKTGDEICGKNGGLERLGNSPVYHRVIFSPDGRYVVAAGAGSSIFIFDLERYFSPGLLKTSGISACILDCDSGHQGSVGALAFSPDGQFLYSGGSNDGMVKKWSTSDWKEAEEKAPLRREGQYDWKAVGEIKIHNGGISAFTLNKSGDTLYSAGKDMRLKAWNVTNWSLNFDVPIVDGDGKESDDPKDKQSLRNVTLSGDQSSLYVASLDWPVKMFDAVTGEKRGEPFGDKPAWDVEPLPGSSRVVTIHTGGAIKVWEPSASEPLATADADWPRGNISDIDVSDDGSLIGISNWNGLTSLWTFDGQNLVKVAPKDQTIEVDGEVYTLAYTSGDFLGKITGLSVIDDGKAFIAATDYGTITLNDIATGHIMSDLRATDELYPVSGFSIGPGNRIATAHTFGRANVWNWKEDKHLVRMKEPLKEHVSAIAWSAGGNAIVTADWAGKVMLWDVATGQYLRTFESPADDVRIFALAVIDQNVIAGDDNGMLHVWDIVSGTLLFEFKAHPHWITDIAIPPVRDQYDFFTSCANGAIVAWKLGSGKAEQVLVLDQSNPDGCGQIRISPDGTFLASTHNDGARIWDLTPNYQAFGERVKAFKHGHNGPTTAIAITPDSKRLLTGGKDKTVILWKVKD